MARVKYIDLLGDYRGKVSTPKYKDEAIFVSRQKCYGVDKHGRPITGLSGAKLPRGSGQ